MLPTFATASTEQPETAPRSADPQPVPQHAPLQHDPHIPRPAKQGTLFVNFDGAVLSNGFDDSRVNRTQVMELAGEFAAYGDDAAKREAVMQAVRDDWSRFNVVVTDSRPPSGDYTMTMVGPTNPYGGGTLGIAPLDCNDAQTHNNITFAFHAANDGFSAAMTATTIGQETAHSYGLEHVQETGDIMNPYAAGGDPAFLDACITVVGGTVCTAQHMASCGNPSAQNAVQELLALFGTSEPDTGRPTVTITSPVDGQVLAAGEGFEITAEAEDDTLLAEVQLYLDGSSVGTDAQEPFSWVADGLDPGAHELYAVALDHAGNEGFSDVVTITVGSDPTPTTTGGGSDDPDAPGGGTGSTGTPDGSTTGPDWLPPDQDSPATGCGCRQGTPPSALLWCFLLPQMRRRER